jgi:O-antigen/teichoic acid export membrane protein
MIDQVEDEGVKLPEKMQLSDRNAVVTSASRSVKWAWFSSIFPRLITPLSTIILAALLSPAEFGIVAVSTIVISLAQVVVGFGMQAAIIQRRSEVAEAALVAFWLSLSLACGLYALLFLLSPWIAVLYRDPLISPVVRVAGISLILNALKGVPHALLQRELSFRRLFWIDTLPLILAALASIAMALAGVGVWALVIGPLLGIAVSTALTWLVVRWRPAFSLQRELLFPLVGFGTWMLINGFQTWLFLYADNAIAGYFFGSQGLGVYSLGFNISNLLPAMIIAPLSTVAYPAFSALQDDQQKMGADLARLQLLIAAVVFPVTFGLSAIAVPVVHLLYGDRWQGLGFVISLMAIMPGLSHLWSLNADAIRAIGRPDVWARINAITLLVLIPLLLVGGTIGFTTFTLARFAGASILPVCAIIMTARLLNLSISEQVRGLLATLLPSLVMFTVAVVMIGFMAPFEGIAGWVKLCLVVFTSCMVYLLLIWKTRHALFQQLVAAGVQVLRRN